MQNIALDKSYLKAGGAAFVLYICITFVGSVYFPDIHASLIASIGFFVSIPLASKWQMPGLGLIKPIVLAFACSAGTAVGTLVY